MANAKKIWEKGQDEKKQKSSSVQVTSGGPAAAAVNKIAGQAQQAATGKQRASQAAVDQMLAKAKQSQYTTVAEAIRAGQQPVSKPAATQPTITAGKESTTPLAKAAGSSAIKNKLAAAAETSRLGKDSMVGRTQRATTAGGALTGIVKSGLQSQPTSAQRLNSLATRINDNEQQLINWGRRLSVLKAKANRGDEGAVASYNLLADKYNAAFEDYVSDIGAYNKLYNGAYRDSAVRDNYARREYMQQRQANRDLGARRSYQQRLNEEEARAPQETTLRRKGASVGEHSYKRITGEEPREAGYTFTHEPTRLQQWGRAIHNSYVGNMKAAAGAFYRNSIPEGGSVSGMNSEIGVSDQSKARLQYWSNELLSSGREQSNLGTYQTSLATQGLGTFGTFIVDTSIAGIQMLMDMGISVVTGGSMLPAMFVRSMGGGYLTAEQMGASSEEALAYGIGVGAVEALSEKMFSVFSIGNRFAKGAVNKEMSERIIDRLLKNMTLTPKGKTALNRLFTILFATGSEGLEEVAAGIMEPVIRKITMDPKLDIKSEIDWQEALYEGLIGGLLGGIGGAVDLVNTKGPYWKYYKEGLTEGIDRYVATAKKYGIGSEEALQAAKDIWTAGNEKLNGVAGFIVGANEDGTGGEWVPLIEATQETIDNGLPVTFHQVVAQDALDNYEYGVKDYGIVTSQDLNLRNYLTREENARKEAENQRLEAARREEAARLEAEEKARVATEKPAQTATEGETVRLDTASSARAAELASLPTANIAAAGGTSQGAADLNGIPEEEMTQEEKDELQYGSGAVEDLGKYSGLAQRMGAPKTGRRTGLALRTPGVQQQAANLQQRVRGLSVVYKSMRSNMPGYVDRATGTIYLNSNVSKEKLLRSTLGHELLHFLKTGDPQLIDDIIAYMAQIGEDVQGEIARLRPLYEKEIREIYAADPAKMQQKLAELDEPGYFEEEVAANFIGRICEEQSETLDRFAAEKPGVLRRLVEALRRLLRELGATPEMQERIEVYEQAIARMNAALAKAGQNETTGAGGERFTFGGENAVNADLDALGQAVDMDAAGTEMRDIFRETGWFKGADGKWRFEIDDSKMKYRHQGDLNYMKDPEYREYVGLWDKVVASFDVPEEEELERFYELDRRYKNVVPQAVYRVTEGGAVLSDIIEHEELFENYPQLRNAPIRFDKLPQGDKGNYNPITNELTLNRSLREAPEDTLVHEIQHALQSIEGFSEGASPEYWKRNAPAGEERSAYQLYRNTAGEIEARDVTARRKMSEEQRRNTMPDTGNEDTVFAERGSGDARELTPDELPADLIGNLDFGDDVRFNLRSMEEDKEDFRKDLASIMDEAELDELFDAVDEVMAYVSEHREELDYGAELSRYNRPFLPVKPNSDEHYKFAIDFSTLCRKRILIQAITERLQQELGRGLDPIESVRIREELVKLRDAGAQIDVACGLCYVEAARFNAMKYVNTFLADPRAVMIDYLSKKNRTWIRNVLEPMQQRYWESLGKTGKYNKQKLNTEQKNKINEENKKLRATYKPESERELALLQRLEEIDKNQFLSVDGLTKLAADEETYPIYDAFITFLRDRGRAKAQESRSPYYKGDLMRATSGGKKLVTEAMILQLNEESGSRMQSWSDFEVLHLLDLMSAVMDLALNKAKAHCYTKVPDLVRVAGETGVMYNMSLIPAGDTGLNAEGKLDASCYDPHEGIPFEVMKDLRDEFPDTAGNICIGINDAQIRALMASPDIDFIIPYHESGLPKELKAMLGLHDWDSYQQWQNEKPDSHKTGDRKKPALKDWFSIEEARSFDGDGYAYMEHASRNYLKYCDEHGLVPIFPMFTGEDHLTPEPGYWKLLIDRKMVNQMTGEIIEQQVVRPKFKKSTLLGVMEQEIDSDVRQEQQQAIDTVVERVLTGQTSLSQQMDQDLQALGVLLQDAPMLNAVEKAGEEKGEDIRHRFLPEEEESGEQTKTAADETTPESKLQATIQKLTEQVTRLTDRLDGKESEAPVSQAINSAKTSIKQIPALFRNKNVEFGETNIDIGGGRFDLATDYLKSIGTENMVFDPYNRSAETNSATLRFLQEGNKADTATCANVLNVIREPEARANVILEAAKAIKPDGAAYFMVYEGDGSGTGKETSSGWQNNRPTASYVSEIERYFGNVTRQGKLITARDPIADLPQAAWEIEPGSAVRFSFTEDEGEPKNKYGIDDDVVKAIQSIGRKSVNSFTSAEINKTEKFARKFWEELGVKSPFFRAWFGDWRAYDKTPINIVPVVSGKQFNKGRATNADTDTIFTWGKEFQKETTVHQRGGGIAANVLGDIDALVQNAILLDTNVSALTSRGKLPGTAFMHSFYVVVNDGNGVHLLKLYAEEGLSAKKKVITRAYELKDIVKVATLTNSAHPVSGGLTKVNVTTINNVADLYAFVKQYDPDFTAAPKVDKAMLEDDGKPKLMYHGTDADFTVFDRTKGRSTMDIQGMFFSPWEIDAGGYGEKVGAYYLSIKNPAPEAVAYKALNRFKGQNDAGVKAREYLISLGYDGVNNSNEEYIAFYPEQIKSATDNIGTFDKNNPDVRYSFTEEEGTEAEAPKDLESMEPSERSKELIATAAKAKQVKRQTEKILRKIDLTEKEQGLVNALLSGALTVDELPRGINRRAVIQAYEAKKAARDAAAPVEEYNKKHREGLNEEARDACQNSADWKSKKFEFGYEAETPRRIFYGLTKDEAEADKLTRIYVDPIREHEAMKNRMVKAYNDRIKKLGIETRKRSGNKVSEAYAVQYVGELEFTIGWLEELPEGETRGGVTYGEAKTLLREFWEENPNLDKEKIHRCVAEFRSIYDELFAMINEARVINGYAPIDYRKGYFPHFTSNTADTVVQALARGLGFGVEVTELPTDIAGLTYMFKPGIQWSGHMLARTGNETDYNCLEGWDRYIPAVANIIYHTEDIQRWRALERTLRYKHGTPGVRDEMDKIRKRKDITEAEREEAFEKLLGEDGKADVTHLSSFVQWVGEYTNFLAGKRHLVDRIIEQKLGRQWYHVIQKLENRVAGNMLAGNISSVMTNFAPMFQALGNVRSTSMLQAIGSYAIGKVQHDVWRDGSNFLVNRKGYDPLYNNAFGKAKDALFAPFNWVDDFVSEVIVRAKYIDELRNGASPEEAMMTADVFAGSVIADRAIGELPVVYNSKALKVITMFQVEVNNDLRFLFKDLPRDAKKKGSAPLLAIVRSMLRYLLAVYMFDDLFEALFGRRIVFDPLSTINDLSGLAFGKKLPNGFEVMAEWIRTKEAPDWDSMFDADKSDKPLKDLWEVSKEAAGNLPFVSGLFGGGRYPVFAFLPNAKQTESGLDAWDDLLFGHENDAKYDWQQIYKMNRNALTYLLPPVFGGQLRRTAEGIMAASKEGSYNLTKKGEILQYPILTTYDIVKAAIFGKNTTKGGKEWVKSDFDSLSVEETQAYIDLVTAGSDGQKIYDVLRDLHGGDRDEVTKAYALASADLTSSERVRLLDALVSESQGEKFAAMMTDGGLTFRQCAEVYDKYHELSKMGEEKNADDSYVYKKAYLATQFAAWIDGEGYTDEQKEVIEGQYKFWNRVPAEANSYEHLTALGLSTDHAVALSNDWAELEPLPGEDDVTWLQKVGYAATGAGYLSSYERHMAIRNLQSTKEDSNGLTKQDKYQQYIVDYDIPADVYYYYAQTTNGMTGDDLDGDGVNDANTLIDKKLAVIDRLPLQPGQKTALALFDKGSCKDTTIYKRAPWLH